MRKKLCLSAKTDTSFTLIIQCKLYFACTSRTQPFAMFKNCNRYTEKRIYF